MNALLWEFGNHQNSTRVSWVDSQTERIVYCTPFGEKKKSVW